MSYNYNNNNNADHYNSQNTRYYPNSGPGNEYDNNQYIRNPQYSENRVHNPPYVNYPPANYNNNYDGGGYPRNEYTSPGGNEYGGSGYPDPYNTSRSNTLHKNPTFYNDSYNPPYYSSSTNYPSSPAMSGMNPTYPPISGRQGDHPKDNYNEKEMHSSNLGPANNGQVSPTYSNKPFLYDDDDEKHAKPGGLMKYCCCGGRPTCCKICTILCIILVILIILAVVAVVLWGRPPKVSFLGIIPSPLGLPAYNSGPSGFDFNLGLKIQVDNPNIVGANFKMIKAVAFYPGHSDSIGGGNLTNVSIESKQNTTIEFPFSVNYDKDLDPGFSILFDIAQKCGLTGEPKEQLEIDYKLSLTLNVLAIPINLPNLDRKAMIDCPIQDGKIPDIPGFDLGKAAKAFSKGKKKKRDLDLILTPLTPERKY